MQAIGNDLYVGLGNEPAGSDGALVAKWDGAVLTAEHVLDEQGCHDMHAHGAELWVSGTDPTEDWTLGNVYYRNAAGTWTKRRTLPKTMHTWGLYHDAGGNLFAATGSHTGDSSTWEGRVMRSTDDGATWAQDVRVNDYRVYDVIGFGSRLYAIGYDYQAGYVRQLLYSTDAGLTWSVESGVTPYRLARFVLWNSKLAAVDGGRDRLIIVASDFSVSYVDLPSETEVRNPVLNPLASDGTYLYMIAESGYIYRLDAAEEWTCYSYVEDAIGIAYWAGDSALMVGDVGVTARLWRVGV